MRAAPGWVRPSVFVCPRGCLVARCGAFTCNERGRCIAVVRWVLMGSVSSSGVCSDVWRLLGLWLVCAAQGYDQGGGADQEEGGDGGADADE